MPAATHIPLPSYRRRQPEKEPLYHILAEHLETFLQQARTAEHHLPFHVEKEMRAYLECGVLAYGAGIDCKRRHWGTPRGAAVR